MHMNVLKNINIHFFKFMQHGIYILLDCILFIVNVIK